MGTKVDGLTNSRWRRRMAGMWKRMDGKRGELEEQKVHMRSELAFPRKRFDTLY